jgi:Uma2 family endonuclease
VAFDSSAGFRLPNKATRSPDAAWVLKSRLKRFSREEQRKFLALCPDFVVELKFPTDRLTQLKRKMQEYIENGARLGWLIDPDYRRVFVYRPGVAVECLKNIESLAGEPILPGFVLDLGEIWEPDI